MAFKGLTEEESSFLKDTAKKLDEFCDLHPEWSYMINYKIP